MEVEGELVGQIGRGLLVYVGVGRGDGAADAEYLGEKLAGLRIFADEGGKMNRSVLDVGGGILLVSNFTVQGDCRSGRRPGFDGAAAPKLAEGLYELLAEFIGQRGVAVEKGVFGGHMEISSVNDGPVTFLLDSKRQF